MGDNIIKERSDLYIYPSCVTSVQLRRLNGLHMSQTGEAKYDIEFS
jgi:hypothetical protein